MSNEKINNQNEEVVFISDEEKEKRKTRRTRKQENDNFANEPVIEKKDIAESAYCEIRFETKGRFNTPESMMFKPFSTLDINNIVLTKQEKILDVTLDTLNSLVVSEEGSTPFDLSNMLMEEFLEIMVGIKLRFVSSMHEYKWLCDCQYEYEEDDQKINTEELDLKTLNYTTIEDADKNLQDFMHPFISKMSEDVFDQWKQTTFEGRLEQEEIDNLDVETAVSKIRIEEPIALNAPDGNCYRFRFNRVGDLIIARKMADSKFAPKLASTQQLRYDKKKENPKEYQERKRKIIEEIKEEKAKYAVHVANAMRLVSINGIEYTNNKDRAEAYGKIDTQVTQNLVNFLDTLTFGVNDIREFVCPLCGKTKQRYLRRTLNPVEFLPVDVSSYGERKLDSGFSITFGI